MEEEMEFIEDPRHREPTCEEMAWALARIAALEDVVRELVAECKHLHEFAILKGGCDDEPCRTQVITSKALELVNQGGN